MVELKIRHLPAAFFCECRDEWVQCHRDVIASALIHCEQFKDRRREFEEFFKVDPDADEANLNGSL